MAAAWVNPISSAKFAGNQGGVGRRNQPAVNIEPVFTAEEGEGRFVFADFDGDEGAIGVGHVGGLEAMISSCPPARGASRSPWRKRMRSPTPFRAAFSRATERADWERSVAVIAAAGSLCRERRQLRRSRCRCPQCAEPRTAAPAQSLSRRGARCLGEGRARPAGL